MTKIYLAKSKTEFEFDQNLYPILQRSQALKDLLEDLDLDESYEGRIDLSFNIEPDIFKHYLEFNHQDFSYPVQGRMESPEIEHLLKLFRVASLLEDRWTMDRIALIFDEDEGELFFFSSPIYNDFDYLIKENLCLRIQNKAYLIPPSIALQPGFSKAWLRRNTVDEDLGHEEKAEGLLLLDYYRKVPYFLQRDQTFNQEFIGRYLNDDEVNLKQEDIDEIIMLIEEKSHQGSDIENLKFTLRTVYEMIRYSRYEHVEIKVLPLDEETNLIYYLKFESSPEGVPFFELKFGDIDLLNNFQIEYRDTEYEWTTSQIFKFGESIVHEIYDRTRSYYDRISIFSLSAFRGKDKISPEYNHLQGSFENSNLSLALVKKNYQYDEEMIHFPSQNKFDDWCPGSRAEGNVHLRKPFDLLPDFLQQSVFPGTLSEAFGFRFFQPEDRFFYDVSERMIKLGKDFVVEIQEEFTTEEFTTEDFNILINPESDSFITIYGSKERYLTEIQIDSKGSINRLITSNYEYEVRKDSEEEILVELFPLYDYYIETRREISGTWISVTDNQGREEKSLSVREENFSFVSPNGNLVRNYLFSSQEVIVETYYLDKRFGLRLKYDLSGQIRVIESYEGFGWDKDKQEPFRDEKENLLFHYEEYDEKGFLTKYHDQYPLMIHSQMNETWVRNPFYPLPDSWLNLY